MGPRDRANRTPEMIALGNRIRRLRQERRLTHDRLGELADMNGIQVGHIERGANDPKVSTLLKLARALGVAPGDLLNGLPSREARETDPETDP